MKRIGSLMVAVILAGATAVTAASAATPDTGDEAMSGPQAMAVVPAAYSLDTEMVVRDWVLCVSASSAKRLVEARQSGLSAAREAYEALKSTRACGRFAELRVILRAQLYAPSFEAGGDARAFAAMVHLSGSWASAFVITGSLPEGD